MKALVIQISQHNLENNSLNKSILNLLENLKKEKDCLNYRICLFLFSSDAKIEKRNGYYSHLVRKELERLEIDIPVLVFKNENVEIRGYKNIDKVYSFIYTSLAKIPNFSLKDSSNTIYLLISYSEPAFDLSAIALVNNAPYLAKLVPLEISERIIDSSKDELDVKKCAKKYEDELNKRVEIKCADYSKLTMENQESYLEKYVTQYNYHLVKKETLEYQKKDKIYSKVIDLACAIEIGDFSYVLDNYSHFDEFPKGKKLAKDTRLVYHYIFISLLKMWIDLSKGEISNFLSKIEGVLKDELLLILDTLSSNKGYRNYFSFSSETKTFKLSLEDLISSKGTIKFYLINREYLLHQAVKKYYKNCDNYEFYFISALALFGFVDYFLKDREDICSICHNIAEMYSSNGNKNNGILVKANQLTHQGNIDEDLDIEEGRKFLSLMFDLLSYVCQEDRKFICSEDSVDDVEPSLLGSLTRYLLYKLRNF